MTKFWKVEVFDKGMLKSAEKLCEEKFVESITRDSSGIYRVDLPVLKIN